MRGMLALVGVLTVLLLAGTIAVVGTIIGRHGGGVPAAAAAAPGRVVLNQPAGTHVTAASWNDGRLAVTLQGGGPDRVVVLDGAGHMVLEMRLAP